MAVPDVCASFMVLQNSGMVGVKLWEVGTVKKVDYIHKASSYSYGALHQLLAPQELFAVELFYNWILATK